jgi:hypothetical protein
VKTYTKEDMEGFALFWLCVALLCSLAVGFLTQANTRWGELKSVGARCQQAKDAKYLGNGWWEYSCANGNKLEIPLNPEEMADAP